MKLSYLIALLLSLLGLGLWGANAYAFDDSDGGGYEAPDTDRDPEVNDQDPEVNDRDCEDCDPVEPAPEPEPEPALDNGRDGTCSGCDPFNGR